MKEGAVSKGGSPFLLSDPYQSAELKYATLTVFIYL
jgi:hypothetical protein